MLYDAKCGWYLPDGERHLPGWMASVNDARDGRLLYQGSKYRAAIDYCSDRRVAIDVGAHVGLWSWQMAKDFETVISFEPMPEHRDCYVENLFGNDNLQNHDVVLIADALGAETGTAAIRCRTPGSSGDTGIEPDGEGEIVAVKRLDDVLRDYPGISDRVDFVKLDCEGYELFALQGARETLLQNKPVVIVEQKGNKTGAGEKYGIGDFDAVEFLKDLGAKQRKHMVGDFVFSWD